MELVEGAPLEGRILGASRRQAAVFAHQVLELRAAAAAAFARRVLRALHA